MNNHAFYRHHDNRVPTPQSTADTDPAVLAVHRTLSTPGPSVEDRVKAARPGVTWVRPTELPTALGAVAVRRGIDLQAELVRRTSRIPATASSTAQRIRRSALTRSQPASPADGIAR